MPPRLIESQKKVLAEYNIGAGGGSGGVHNTVSITGRNVTTGVESQTGLNAHEGDTIEIFGTVLRQGLSNVPTCSSCVNIRDITLTSVSLGQVGIGSLGQGKYLFRITVTHEAAIAQPQPRKIVATYKDTNTTSLVLLVNLVPTLTLTCISTAITGFLADTTNTAVGNTINFSGKLVRTDTNVGVGGKTVIVAVDSQKTNVLTTSDGRFSTSFNFLVPNTYTVVAQFNGDTGCP